MNDIENIGIFKEDLDNYQIIIDNYQALSPEDGLTAYDLAKDCILQADRWNEITLNASKFARDLDISKTELRDWAYHKYRILMTMHEFCRVVYRQCKEDLRNGFMDEM